MRIDLITLLPTLFTPFFTEGVCGRAAKNGTVAIHYWNPRDFTSDSRRTVDDRPYGGGSGMVLMAAPIVAASQAAKVANPNAHLIYLTPRGRLFDDQQARRLAKKRGLIFLCGRYRGIDERAVELFAGEEISIGDYVVSGGEIAALTIIDSVLRYIPGVLGNHHSSEEDAFCNGLLDAPCYTRPPCFAQMSVPEVLHSGNHQAIAHWRQQKARQITYHKRPDLIHQQNPSPQPKKED